MTAALPGFGKAYAAIEWSPDPADPRAGPN